MAQDQTHEPVEPLVASDSSQEPVTSAEEAASEPLPELGNIYKELFEIDAVDEVSLSALCCYGGD